MSQADLLRLLEAAHPGRPQADLLAMIEATPDARSIEKPVRRIVGARPRTTASVERRRSLASQGWFPPAVAARFTVGEQATLAVVAQEVARHGDCGLFIEKIAALAGVTRSTVKRALKEAHGLGMIRIEERRLTGWRNDANVVTIVDPGWLLWLQMRRRGEGSKNGPARNTRTSDLSELRSTAAAPEVSGRPGRQDPNAKTGTVRGGAGRRGRDRPGGRL